MSTAVATADRDRAGLAPRHAAWAGIALGVIAWFVALPPILARTPVPSVVLGLAGAAAGGHALSGADRRDAALRHSAPVRRARRPDLRAQRRDQHRHRGHDAHGRVLRDLRRRS